MDNANWRGVIIMATISSETKTAYMYDQETDSWYAIGANVNTANNYVWNGTNSFSNFVSFADVATAKAGINNFQNPTARDNAITSPINGVVCFVRQDDTGSTINQVQYYHNGAWRYVNDAATLANKINNYVLQISDAGKTISMDSPSDRTVTVPLNSTAPFIIGQKVEIIRYGSGNVTITPESSGVTINSKNGNKKIASQYSGAVIMKTDTNTWLLIGDLTA